MEPQISVLSPDADIAPLAYSPNPRCVEWLLEDLSRIPLATSSLDQVPWRIEATDPWDVRSLQEMFAIVPLDGLSADQEVTPLPKSSHGCPGVVWDHAVELRAHPEGPVVRWPAWKIFPLWVFRYLNVPLLAEPGPQGVVRVPYGGLENRAYGVFYPTGERDRIIEALINIMDTRALEEARKEEKDRKEQEAYRPKLLVELEALPRKDQD